MFSTAAQHAADPAYLRVRTGAHYDPAPCACRNEGAAEQHRGLVAENGIGIDSRRAFADRHRLTGENGLLCGQAPRLEQTKISRNPVAGFHQHDIARHQVGGVHAGALSAAQYRRVRCQHLANGLHGLFSAAFLDETDGGIHQHHGKDHARINPVTEHRGHRGRPEQYVDEQIIEVSQEPEHRRRARLIGQPIGTKALQAARCFLAVEAFIRRIDGCQRFSIGKRMKGVARPFDIHHSGLH